ncbi:MAG: hypothetical protein AAFX85_14550 [Pseudomonadota bacterium]
MRLGWLLARKNVVRNPEDGSDSPAPGAAALDLSDIRSLGFWISNLLTIVATVLGVYLAASEGFNQAMQFRQIEENEHTYDLLTALHGELTLNRTRVGDVVSKGLEKLPQSWEEPPQRQRFIWRTMQTVPETFRVPPPALNGVALYYSELDEYLEQAFDERKHPSDQRSAFVKLQRANSVLDDEVMTVIEAKMTELRQKLTRYGVDPDA